MPTVAVSASIIMMPRNLSFSKDIRAGQHFSENSKFTRNVISVIWTTHEFYQTQNSFKWEKQSEVDS